jgi:hypothetical protein
MHYRGFFILWLSMGTNPNWCATNKCPIMWIKEILIEIQANKDCFLEQKLPEFKQQVHCVTSKVGFQCLETIG